jgi:LCCL domain-containing protein
MMALPAWWKITPSMRNLFRLSASSLFFIISSTALAQQSMLVADDGTKAGAFRSQPGKVVTFICPSTLQLNQDIWGTDIYLDESPVCTAALHAGVLTRGTSGQVTIVIGTGAESFSSTQRNGVTSLSYGPYDLSYTFVPNTQPGQIDWSTTYDMVPDDFQSAITVVCPPNGNTDSAVWGTDVFSASSAVCVAALHAGVITLKAGGPVTLTLQPKQETFAASNSNGIVSLGWSSWEYPFYPRPYKPTAGTSRIIGATPDPAIRSEPKLSSTSPGGISGARSITLTGFTVTGNAPMTGMASVVEPRTISLSGFTTTGTAQTVMPRTFSLKGFTVTGTAPTITETAPTVVPRSFSLRGWNFTGNTP